MKGERWWDRDVQVFKHPRISVLLTKATQTIALFFLSLPHTSNTHTHTHTHRMWREERYDNQPMEMELQMFSSVQLQWNKN